MSAPLANEGRIQNVEQFRSNWDEIFKNKVEVSEEVFNSLDKPKVKTTMEKLTTWEDNKLTTWEDNIKKAQNFIDNDVLGDALLAKADLINARARKAYELYCEHCNWDVPQWEAVREDIKSHWEYVVINL